MSSHLDAKPARTSLWYQSSSLLAALAVAAVLALGLWVKRDRLAEMLGRGPVPSGQASSSPATEQATVVDFPAAVELASPRIAHELGIECVAVELRPVEQAIACNGRVSFNQNHYAQIRARIDGIVRSIHADVGSQVTAGETLAVIDSAMLGDVKLMYINALTRRDQLSWEFQRLQKLADDQAIPVKSFRDARAEYEQQKTTTSNARQQLINLGFTSEQIDEIAESKDTSTQLPLVAPWAGVIVSRHAVEGELVERNGGAHQHEDSTGGPLFTIADLSTMWIYLNLYEQDMGKVRLGQTVSFTADGLPDLQFEGPLDWISPEVDHITRISQARAQVPNTQTALRANMFGKARIFISQPTDALVVPRTAVQTYRERPVVFVRESAQRFAVRPVTVGVQGPQVWEISNGVKCGEQVATTGSFLLKSELEKDKLGEAE